VAPTDACHVWARSRAACLCRGLAAVERVIVPHLCFWPPDRQSPTGSECWVRAEGLEAESRKPPIVGRVRSAEPLAVAHAVKPVSTQLTLAPLKVANDRVVKDVPRASCRACFRSPEPVQPDVFPGIPRDWIQGPGPVSSPAPRPTSRVSPFPLQGCDDDGGLCPPENERAAHGL
jgi:hypothetical protein